jgi:conjugal transfer/entry exclusion protein
MHMLRTMLSTNRTFLVLALPVLLWLSACSSTSALCQSVEDLQSSSQDLQNIDVVNDGVNAFTQQLDVVKSSFADVKNEAGDTFSADISAVDSAISEVAAVEQQIEEGAAAQDVAADAVAAISSLAGAVQALITTAQGQDCDLT